MGMGETKETAKSEGMWGEGRGKQVAPALLEIQRLFICCILFNWWLFWHISLFLRDETELYSSFSRKGVWQRRGLVF